MESKSKVWSKALDFLSRNRAVSVDDDEVGGVCLF